jgi:hypothetical protein
MKEKYSNRKAKTALKKRFPRKLLQQILFTDLMGQKFYQVIACFITVGILVQNPADHIFSRVGAVYQVALFQSLIDYFHLFGSPFVL